MDSVQIPQDLHGFIMRYVDSVAQLEALLLLRADPARIWSAETLAARLYIRPDLGASLLQRLESDGFVIRHEAGYRFECRAPEQRALADRLAEFYAANIIPVTNLIHSKPQRIREFADAFKLRDR